MDEDRIRRIARSLTAARMLVCVKPGRVEIVVNRLANQPAHVILHAIELHPGFRAH